MGMRVSKKLEGAPIRPKTYHASIAYYEQGLITYQKFA